MVLEFASSLVQYVKQEYYVLHVIEIKMYALRDPVKIKWRVIDSSLQVLLMHLHI